MPNEPAEVMDIPLHTPPDYDEHETVRTVKEKTIPVVELFGPTIQGEGSVIGQQTYFLRFGLCDYRCTMCDSLHAVLPNLVKANATWMNQEAIFEAVKAFHKPNSTKWITFSGGNPLIHDLTKLCQLLKLDGWKINVETQGTLFKDWLHYVDSLTISPKGPGMGENTDVKVLDLFMDQCATSASEVIRHWRVYNLTKSWDEQLENLQPKICMKIVVFDQQDLDFAAQVFPRYIGQYQLEWEQCYLSLGNPKPPEPDEPETFVDEADKIQKVWEWKQSLLDQYRVLTEDIMTHPILSQVKFLPQWHVFVWGNGQGH